MLKNGTKPQGNELGSHSKLLVEPSTEFVNLDFPSVIGTFYINSGHFSAKRRMAFCLTWWPASAGIVRPSQSEQLECLETARLRITKFYREIHTDVLCSHARYDVTNYFCLVVIAKRPSKMPLLTVSGGISRKWFKRGSPNYRGQPASQSCFRSAAKCDWILHRSA